MTILRLFAWLLRAALALFACAVWIALPFQGFLGLLATATMVSAAGVSVGPTTPSRHPTAFWLSAAALGSLVFVLVVLLRTAARLGVLKLGW